MDSATAGSASNDSASNNSAAKDSATADLRGLRVGAIRGIPVVLQPSWFVIALVIVLTFTPGVRQTTTLSLPASVLVSLAYAVLLLLSVLVHELAHALTARRFGLQVHAVVADLWGGHTSFSDVGAAPGRSALIAVVGPAANGLLAAAAAGVTWALQPGGVPALLLGAVGYVNVFVLVFNLLPGLPLDGGRVIESLVWKLTGQRWRGTVAGAWCGRVVALALVGSVFLIAWRSGAGLGSFSLIWTVVIGWTLWSGASQALGAARLWRRAAALRLADHLEPAVAMPQTGTAWRDAAPTAAAPGRHVVATDDRGTPVGLLARDDVQRWATDPAVAAGTALSSVMTTVSAVTLPASADGERVLQALVDGAVSLLVAVDEQGAVVAVADPDRLARLVVGQP